MPEPKQDGLAEKAEQILTGAMQEFLVHGYAATSMDRVAKAAGVSKATVYTYFQDKEGLFAALVQRFAQRKFSIIQSFCVGRRPSQEAAFLCRAAAYTSATLENVTSPTRH
jgi:TetR/AcrR family transcriptional regulator